MSGLKGGYHRCWGGSCISCMDGTEPSLDATWFSLQETLVITDIANNLIPAGTCVAAIVNAARTVANGAAEMSLLTVAK